ncbi:MAG: biotin/lipoyl-binding protein [Alphaproteobacteria bacterium]|nr:biotin/lipoyl-binding protein [Alphaproteobacteria bacterium]
MKKTPFNSVLIANRGEIVLRIMRTARAQGLRAIAVYTDADAGAEYVEFADQAIRIGAGPVAQSYLSIDAILEAAKSSGAAAVHPGYGFLSESAAFAQAVQDAGLVFIGPTPETIAAMGNKAAAKRLMQQANVPCVPGYEGADQSDAAFTKAAKNIGFPVMIKAAAGGGGRGMRLVENPTDLAAGLKLARAEASGAFGSDELILEAAILRPRHVEIQIFADRQGHIIHLGERDCSTQRRHQKVIEEAPSPAMTPDLRNRMCAAAITAAKAVGYEGAGTVEFLLDGAGNFYFLEMNTRLQVEHPVTEAVTGLDLVAMQFDVARGNPLTVAQSDVAMQGHAIEVRLYAEDPAQGFMPSAGKVLHWQAPNGAGVRVDSGIRAGQEVSVHYDSMLAKITAHGESREQARLALIKALGETVIFGVKTNRDFLIDLLVSEVFANGQATTALIGDLFGPDGPIVPQTDFTDLVALAAHWFRNQQANSAHHANCPPELLGWSSAGRLKSRLRLQVADNVFTLGIEQTSDGRLEITSGEQTATAHWRGGTLRINGVRRPFTVFLHAGASLFLSDPASSFEGQVVTSDRQVQQVGDGKILAPMHGNLVDMLASVGTQIRKGDRLATLEAMKMQHEILADMDGVISAVHFAAGQQVRAGDLLVEIDES